MLLKRYFYLPMTTTLNGVNVSPVNMEDRRTLGIKAGDTVKVHQKIQDKGKTRLQVFEGVVLARKHGNEPGATFTVRKVASGVGVEKIFPLYSPNIDKIEITKRAKVRRAKLYYIREKVAREIKRQMRRMQLTALATESEAEATARKEAEATAQADEEARLVKEAEEKATAEATASEETTEAETKEEVTNDASAETTEAAEEKEETPAKENPAEDEDKDAEEKK